MDTSFARSLWYGSNPKVVRVRYQSALRVRVFRWVHPCGVPQQQPIGQYDRPSAWLESVLQVTLSVFGLTVTGTADLQAESFQHSTFG
jgi:hypothetical protein